VGRVAAQAIEDAVVQAVRNHLPADEPVDDVQLLDRHLSRIELGKNELIISLKPPEQKHSDECNGDTALCIRLPWSPISSTRLSSVDPNPSNYREEPDLKAVQAIVRARHWASELANGTYASVDELAASAKLNSKVVRNELRLAFLGPEILDAILSGKPGCSLPDLRRIAAISWRSQRSELYGNRCPPNLNIKVP
jgi:site-specific DNA recombinase